MIQLVVIECLDDRTHFIELPYLFLESDPINKIGKAHVLQDLEINVYGVVKLHFGQHVNNIFVPQQPNNRSIELVSF